METIEFAYALRAYATRAEKGEGLTGTELAGVLPVLATYEIREGGPYAATPGGALADIGMSLVAARFLNACGVRLPALDSYLDSAIVEGESSSDLFPEEVILPLVVEYRAAREQSSEIGGSGVQVKASGERADAGESRMLALIRAAAEARFASFPEDVRDSARTAIERTMVRNSDGQMSLMPYFMRSALGRRGAQLSDGHIADLGLANAFFWTSFIIYDDFWDEDEAADPRLLPIANLLARHYTGYFVSLLPEAAGFRQFFYDSMDALSTANAWETRECRMKVFGTRIRVPKHLPEYGDFSIKYHPAAGHVMGPVAMLVQSGYAIDSAEVVALVEYFKHYLVGMQLNDDAHDWKEDLSRGHLSTGVTMLMKRWQEMYPDSGEIDMIADMPELERIFWFDVLTPLCEAVLDHAARSREALRSLSILEDLASLERFIIRNERVANEALSECKKSKEFLGAL